MALHDKVATLVVNMQSIALECLFILVDKFQEFVRVLTSRAQVIIAKPMNAKEKLKNITSFKIDGIFAILFKITS